MKVPSFISPEEVILKLLVGGWEVGPLKSSRQHTELRKAVWGQTCGLRGNGVQLRPKFWEGEGNTGLPNFRSIS